MINFFRNNIRIVIFSCLAVLLLILSGCINWGGTDIFNVIYLPLKGIGDYIRSLGNTVGGWALYIFLGLLPLVYPIVKIIKNRKFCWLSLNWAALSIFDYIMLYFFINPHLLDNKIVSGTTQLNKITLIGFEVTFFILLLMCVLFEVGSLLKRKPEKSYICAKIAIDVLIFIIIFNVCFMGVLTAKSGFEKIGAALSDGINFNADLNRFTVIFSLLINFVPSVFTVILLYKCIDFIDRLNCDSFSPKNIDPLKSIIKFAKLTVIITLTATAVENILNIALSKLLLDANYNFNIPLVSLLTVCLVIIFSEILIRAINLNEEQKLVI